MKMHSSLLVDQSSYKIGVDEISGIKDVLTELLEPVRAAIQENVYWSKVELSDAPYKWRDGFIPHSHNCGGIKIFEVIPKCEECNFEYLEFGEWDGTHCCDGSDIDNCDCAHDVDGHYDAALEIWLKFEGFDDKGNMQFYLVMSGGNHDAPYFRNTPTVFESEFKAKTLEQLKTVGKKHVQKLLKAMGEK